MFSQAVLAPRGTAEDMLSELNKTYGVDISQDTMNKIVSRQYYEQQGRTGQQVTQMEAGRDDHHLGVVRQGEQGQAAAVADRELLG